MADKPILFSGPMVRALLAGTKTQTRRLVREQPTQRTDGLWDHHGYEAGIIAADAAHLGQWMADFQRIQVGDRLYVRETFSGLWEFEGIPPREWPHPYPLWYWADGNPQDGDWTKPRPGIHMPRWASRLTLTVTDVRVERVQDISEADAQAEGCDDGGLCKPVFQRLWNSINGPDSWTANPWVAAYTFTVQMGNIDALARAA